MKKKIIKVFKHNLRHLDVLTHLETYQGAERKIDEIQWIAVTYECSRAEAEKMIAEARRYEVMLNGVK